MRLRPARDITDVLWRSRQQRSKTTALTFIFLLDFACGPNPSLGHITHSSRVQYRHVAGISPVCYSHHLHSVFLKYIKAKKNIIELWLPQCSIYNWWLFLEDYPIRTRTKTLTQSVRPQTERDKENKTLFITTAQFITVPSVKIRMKRT